MFETSTQTAEIGQYGGRRWRRRRWERQGEGGIDSREAEYGEAG